MIPAEFVAAAEEFCDAAGAVIRPLFRSALLVEAKGDASPVTQADRDAEAAIDPRSDRPALPQPWRDRRGARRRPPRRRMGLGAGSDRRHPRLRHRPAAVRLAGVAAAPRRCPAVGQAELSTTSPDVYGPAERPGFERLRGAARRVTWGGDCYAYGLLALGLVDIVLDATMNLWDWAALVPVVEGAGGRVTGWRGEALTASSDGRVLAVGDPALLPEAIRLLTDP